MTFATGSLVRARGREWVVLPGSRHDLLMVRPLGGTDDETTGIVTTLEAVSSASFALPDPSKLGDHRSCRFLRDALRLGFRSSAGPFRSFGQIGVEPRPYQLVPLLMALRLDPVRLLIADDVGVGKTIEAGLIAKELLAQGDAERLAVLCPPHLADQWRRELQEKFNVSAELVLPATVGRLERGLPYGTSLFERYPFVIVSIDFIKGDRYKDEFARTCPELVIVDEAHGCTLGAERGRQRRHELVSRLAHDTARHLILVTATPHSGKEDAFRSLIALLEPALASLPEDLSGAENAAHRRTLSRHLVQRRRGDIQHYLGAETPLPTREDAEATYSLSPEYRRLFDRVLGYAREVVRDPVGGHHRQRVRWWSALALLRSLASSPAAAAETLRNRATTADTQSEEEADEVGRRTVLDAADDETMEGTDVTPGADDAPEGEDVDKGERRRLREMARAADDLRGAKDQKLKKAVELVTALLNGGYRPILFCRFIATAEYVAEELRFALGKSVEVAAVTGRYVPEEREQRVLGLAGHDRRVLVATDCLSEGVNLQDYFDAVVHYDLSWNPTRHEQREGRVDRYGQRKPVVRTLTFYGIDNQIDGIVLDVLIRKSKAIRKSLGVSVPVPEDTNSVIEAVFEGLLLREQSGGIADRLPGFDEYFRPKRDDLHAEWDRVVEREKRSRTMFAQESLKPDEVARELVETQAAIGAETDVRRFVTEALAASGATIMTNGSVRIDLAGTPVAVRDAIGVSGSIKARFELPVGEEELYLTRTSPLVEGLATHVLDTALDGSDGAIARRCGTIRTLDVETRTTLLLLRFRFDLITTRGDESHTQLAEACGLLAFEGSPEEPRWLDEDAAERLLTVEPSSNVPVTQAAEFVENVVSAMRVLESRLDQEAAHSAKELELAHGRVRGSGSCNRHSNSGRAAAPRRRARDLRSPTAAENLMHIRRSANPFTTVRSEGGLLPPELLQRVVDGDRALPGLAPGDYHLGPSERLNERISRSWNRLVGLWASFAPSLAKMGGGEAGTGPTRERWLLPLFTELDFGRLQSAKAEEIDGKSFPVSHRWGLQMPIHLVGAGVDLDHRSAGVAGAARTSPHGLVQEVLNCTDALWGIVSNGRLLRLLRDNASLTRQAYIEFDLEAMMSGEVYADFALLFLLLHESRFEAERLAECVLEQWVQAAQAQGTRIREQLRTGVEEAIETLGAGFLAHPGNARLREKLRSGDLGTLDCYRQLLRLVYRMIFLFVAEDRNLLHPPDAPDLSRTTYQSYYSTTRVRNLAERRRGTRHPDLYEATKVVTTALGRDEGQPLSVFPSWAVTCFRSTPAQTSTARPSPMWTSSVLFAPSRSRSRTTSCGRWTTATLAPRSSDRSTNRFLSCTPRSTRTQRPSR